MADACQDNSNDNYYEDNYSYHGTIARNNTPDTRYLQTRRRNRQRNNEQFCPRTLKQSLKHVPLTKGDKHNYKDHDGISNVYVHSNISNKIILPRLNNLEGEDTALQSVNKGNFNGADQSSDLELGWLPQPKSNTEELRQKITKVFEKFYLPPVRRSLSTSSSILSVMDLDIPTNPHTEIVRVDAPHETLNDERGRHEHTNKSSHVVFPPMANVKVQHSRQKNVFES